jgi:hypothetical protein
MDQIPSAYNEHVEVREQLKIPREQAQQEQDCRLPVRLIWLLRHSIPFRSWRQEVAKRGAILAYNIYYNIKIVLIYRLQKKSVAFSSLKTTVVFKRLLFLLGLACICLLPVRRPGRPFFA